jgi:plastocyanin
VSSQAQGAAKTHRRPKLSALMLAVALIALAGCGSSSSTTSSTTTATTTTASTPTATTPPATTSSATSTTASTATPPPPAGAGQALTLEANREGQLEYNKTALAANAGKVSIDFTNLSPLSHNLTVESSTHKILGATPTFQGATKVLTLNLPAGTYKFFCSVPGHRAAGMEGTLTVK